MSEKSIEEQFKKLTDIDHVLLLSTRYIGSISKHTSLSWLVNNGNMVKKEVSWNPGFLKMFDEIITNSVDEFKRPSSKLNIIKVYINRNTGEFSVWDNGGIPVVMHKEEKVYVPEMLFKELKCGSNFDISQDRDWSGTHGEGAGLVNIFSKKFIVKTADGKNQFKQVFQNNTRIVGSPQIKSSNNNYTHITWLPDYEKLNTILDEGNYQKIIKRIYDICACNPKLKIYLNDKRIKINSFKDYIELYTKEFIYEENENENWKIGVAESNEGFDHISFVNGEHTADGGTHVDYITNQIQNKLREFFKKKYKVDVKPSIIKDHLTLFIDSTIINPKYTGQTKDKLETEVRDYKTKYTVSDKFIRKIIVSPIIQNVLDWVEAKKYQQEQQRLRQLNKEKAKINPRRIVKFSDANEKKNRNKCILFLTEGDSASKAINSARDTLTMGTYPLKGKPINVSDVKISKLLGLDKKDKTIENEFVNFMTIMGLQIGVKVEDPKELYFGKIATMTDADTDGSHIVGLTINMIYKFWPELFKFGMIYRFITPLIKVYIGKKTLEFFNESDFNSWKEKNKNVKFKSKYFKGLGTSKTADFEKYLSDLDKYLIPLTIENMEDTESIDLAFNKARSDDRKKWLELEEK